MKLIKFIFILLFAITSCSHQKNESSSKPSADGFSLHPQKFKLPHSDEKPAKLARKQIANISEMGLPDNLILLHNFLNGQHRQLRSVELSLFVSGNNVDASAISEDVLAILDKREDKLILYNLQNHRYTDIATKGNEHGDLLFTKDMQTVDREIYITTRNGLSLFDCETLPCRQDKIFHTDFNSYSTALADSAYITLGLYSTGTETNPEASLNLHKMNDSGEVLSSFSKIYGDNNHKIREALIENSSVRYSPQYNVIVLAYSAFPYLYVYHPDGEFRYKLELPDYQQRYYEFNDNENYGRFQKSDHSTTSKIEFINSHWLLLTTRNTIIDDKEKTEYLRYDYSIVHMGSRDYYKIGEDVVLPSTKERVIHMTDYGLLVNQKGTLFWVPL